MTEMKESRVMSLPSGQLCDCQVSKHNDSMKETKRKRKKRGKTEGEREEEVTVKGEKGTISLRPQAMRKIKQPATSSSY